MEGDTYPVRAAYGDPAQMTREMVRQDLDSDLPQGLGCLYHSMSYALMSVDDFFAACRHFGLDHLLFDIEHSEVLGELAMRRARGAKPTVREPPFGLEGEASREYADAALDVYERRVAEAEAVAGVRAALRGAAPRSALPPGPARRLPPLPPRAGGGESCPISTANGGTVEMTRARTRHLIGLVAPHGLAYLEYHLYMCGLNRVAFEDVCRHFGLGHLLVDVTGRDVLAELEARRARGAKPTARGLPIMVGEEEREYADAMLDAYERRAARAAGVAREALLEAAPQAT